MKIRGKNLILGKKLFQIQDKSNVTRPRLLYYINNIPIAVFSNIYIFIDLVNYKARYQAIDIIQDNNNISNFWQVLN